MANALIVQVLQKGPCGANQTVYTDIGSADNLEEQGLTGPRSEKHCQQITALLVATKPNNTCFSSRCYLLFT